VFETLTKAEQGYYQHLEEMGCVSLGLVGAGLRGGFQDTGELHLMKYDQAMNSKDKKSWGKVVDEEHGRMEKYKVFKAVKKNTLPKKAKVLSSTWEMKKKSNGTYCARVTARGYEQINGIHYDEGTKASPFVNKATILITFVLMLLAGWVGYIVDVNSALLHGHFGEKHKMYMNIPKGFENIMGLMSCCCYRELSMGPSRQCYSFGVSFLSLS
jgi:Reverse transcriptase (RNA-dependent DNA polymerase)